MGAPVRTVAAGAALLGAALLVAAGAAAWRARERMRHLAVPVLADPTLPGEPGAEVGEVDGWEAAEVAQVGARVTALLEDGSGALWVGTFDGGLLRAEPAHPPTATSPPARSSGTRSLHEIPGLRGRERFVNALAEHDGLVWAATQGGLLALDGDRRALALLADEGVTALTRVSPVSPRAAAGAGPGEGGGALYAGTARGVFRVSAAEGAEALEAAGPSGEPLRVTALAAGAAHLWIGTASGAYSLPLASAAAPLLARAARWHPLVFGDPPADTNVVTALAPLGDGALAGTDDGGVVRLRAAGGVSALRFVDARANEVNPGAAAPLAEGAALGTQGAGVLLVRADGRGLAAVRLAAAGRAEVSAVRASGDRILLGTAGGLVLELRRAPASALTRGAGGAPGGAAP
jgi:hypothetical protein